MKTNNNSRMPKKNVNCKHKIASLIRNSPNWPATYHAPNFRDRRSLWRGGVVVITAAQLHSTKSELRFCAGSNPACGVSEICDGENFWQWSRLEIRCKRLSSVNHSAKTIHHHHHHHHHEFVSGTHSYMINMSTVKSQRLKVSKSK